MKVSPSKIFFRGVAGKCPNCGASKEYLFRTYFKTHRECQVCDLELHQDGFYLSALVINYGLVVFGYIIPLLLLSYAVHLPREVLFGAMFLGSIGFPFLIYRWSWTLWLGTYYLFIPHELPRNQEEESSQ